MEVSGHPFGCADQQGRSQMIRRILKVVGWSAVGTVGLVIVLYVIAVTINWRDREPSAAAVRFTNFYNQRPVVSDQDNAYIYSMGFSVAPGEDPGQMGSRRVAWMRESNRAARWDTANDPLRERYDYRGNRLSGVQKFVDACKPQSANCAAAFVAGGAVFEQWIGSENWLLERYRELIAHHLWRDAMPFDVAAPLPPYALVMDGQRLLLLNAKQLAESGDSVAVSKLLGEDLRFWRMVLESSDTLISRMIATAAINRHFELGSLIFGQMRPADVMSAIPANWRIAVSESELSMHRCLVGEWMFMSAALRNTDADLVGLHEDSVVARTMRGLISPLYQPQDSVNRNAEYIWRMNEILSVPIERYEDSVNRTAEFSEQTRSEALPPRTAYNIVGQVLIGLGAYDFGTYARRVADLEGVRRAALVAVTFRAAKVGMPEVAAELAAVPLRNPYNNRPFEWDGKNRDILFRGLELGERGEHRIHY
jgi:hypothetical protein